MTFAYFVSACMQVHTCWRSSDDFQEWVLFFYHMGSGDQSQAMRLGNNPLYLLSHPTSPAPPLASTGDLG